MDAATLRQLEENFPDRNTTQGVCIGNLTTKAINTELAFGRFRLYGNEEKKSELVVEYRYTLGHMFTENEVYTFDLTLLGSAVLNLPVPPTINAKAVKL